MRKRGQLASITSDISSAPETVYNQIRGICLIAFEDMDEQSVKNIARLA